MCLVRRAFHCVSVLGLVCCVYEHEYLTFSVSSRCAFFVGASRLVLGSALRLDVRILRN